MIISLNLYLEISSFKALLEKIVLIFVILKANGKLLQKS